MRTGLKTRTNIGAAFFACALVACAPQEDVERYGLYPTQNTASQAYLPLVPLSFFDLGNYTPVDPNNLSGRIARLRAKIRTLAGPVIPARDRARLEAAIARR